MPKNITQDRFSNLQQKAQCMITINCRIDAPCFECKFDVVIYVYESLKRVGYFSVFYLFVDM